MLGNGIFSSGIYYETILTGKWKKTAHTDNILVELCVYSSTVNKREVSIQWAQRNAAYVNEYLLNIQFFLSSNRKMIKSILILEFYWLNTPTNGTHKTCYWGLMVAREDKRDGLSWKKASHWNREEGHINPDWKERILPSGYWSQLVASGTALNWSLLFWPLTTLYVFNTTSSQQAYDHPTMPKGQDDDSFWALKASTLTETLNVTKLDK